MLVLDYTTSLGTTDFSLMKQYAGNFIDVLLSGGGGGTNPPSEPTGVTASQSGSNVSISWNSSSGATSYRVYRSSSASGTYTQLGTPSSTSYTDNSPLTGDNYYKVKAVNSAGDSGYSDYTYCYFSGGGGTNPPSAPTGVTATQSGSSVYISWNSSSGATSYKIYRSSSAYGTYTELSMAEPIVQPWIHDVYPLTGDNYYKVKAFNSDGESSYSDYAYCNVSGGSDLTIGMFYQGGIIVYLDNTKQHGLIAAPEDQGWAQWYNGSYVTTSATGTAIGTGKSNTTKIIQSQGYGAYAAKICDDLVLNGYSDWYLPSKDELNEVYKNRTYLKLAPFIPYWSSSETSYNTAWEQDFGSGYLGESSKNESCRVHAVRAF